MTKSHKKGGWVLGQQNDPTDAQKRQREKRLDDWLDYTDDSGVDHFVAGFAEGYDSSPIWKGCGAGTGRRAGHL